MRWITNKPSNIFFFRFTFSTYILSDSNHFFSHNEETTTLVYKAINSLIRNVIMLVLMGDRERQRDWGLLWLTSSWLDIFQSKSESIWLYIISSDLNHIFLTHVEIHISELFFFMFNSAATPIPGWRPRRRVLSTRLTASLLTDRLTLLSLSNFLNAHTLFLPVVNSFDTFPLSLVYIDAYPVLKFWTNRSVKDQYIILLLFLL